MADEHGGNIFLDAIGKMILGLDGVQDIKIDQTWEGLHVSVFPVHGYAEKTLEDEIHAAVVKNFPLVKEHVHVSIESVMAPLAGTLKPSPRLILERVNISHNPDNQFSVTVRLSRPGSASVEVAREGVYHLENVIRLAAEATLEAALTFFLQRVSGMILGTKHVEIASENLVIVLLSLHLREGQVNTSGSASTKRGSHIGAVSATLKAINRYLEFYGRQ